jgi:hypothetical protein
LRLERQRLGQLPRDLDQGARDPFFIALGQRAAGAAGCDRERRKHRELTGECLGRGDADFRAVNIITGFFETKRERSLVEHRDITDLPSREITRPYPLNCLATALFGRAAYFII